MTAWAVMLGQAGWASLVTPGLAAAGLLAAGVPIAIHLLTRLRRRPQPWAAMRFLMEALRQQQRRVRLEQLLLLALRCLVLVVLGLALASPLVPKPAAGLPGRDPRLVVVVLDQGLTSRTEEGAESRFARMKADAIAMLESLPGDDRAAVVTAGRPHRAATVLEGVPASEALAAVKAIEPVWGESELVGALTWLASELQKRGTRPERTVVAVWSDFGLASVDATSMLSPQLATLGKHSRLVVCKPAGSRGNIGLKVLEPARLALYRGGQELALSVKATLTRVGEGSEGGGALTTAVEAALEGGPGRSVSRRRTVTWTAGQREQDVTFELPLAALLAGSGAAAGEAAGGEGATEALALQVRLTADPAANALGADDERFAALELRPRLRVGLADEERGERGGGFSSRDWVRLALEAGEAAGGGGAGGLEVRPLAAGAVDGKSLERLDAVVLLRPDLVTEGGWRDLGAWVRGGGRLWIVPPATEGVSSWSPRLGQHLGVNWKVDLQSVTPSAEEGSWSLALDTPTPRALSLLSPDWEALLRPVRVMRRLGVTAPEGQGAAWLAVATGDRPPLLLVGSSGEGSVLLLATALDPQWSNLPAKPLFVPLLHESLRGLIGTAPELARLNQVISGDRPRLPESLGEAGELVLRRSGAGAAEGAESVGVARGESGLTVSRALDRPGVYGARRGAAVQVAVNVNGAAADTRTVDAERLSRWLDQFGSWSWMEGKSGGMALSGEQDRMNLSVALLWLTLAAAVAEMFVARRFSHAESAEAGSVWRWLARKWKGVGP